MSVYKIERGLLFQDGIDISNTSAEELKESANTLLLYSKFKASVEKSLETYFGTQTKKAPAKKAVSKPKETPVAKEEASVEVPLPSGGAVGNASSGEVF